MKSRKKALNLATAALIATLYVVLTYIASAFGLSSGAIQIRFSEALTILPVFTPAAIPGLFIGCATANILTGCAIWDIIFGSFATLLGAIGTYLLRKYRILPLIPPILANALIIPPVLIQVYGATEAYWFLLLTVGAGEIISCGIFGYILRKTVEKKNLFKQINK